ncbi:hypothetical protein JCM10213v2_002516 [Rhodosporidiobolus nylandii]
MSTPSVQRIDRERLQTDLQYRVAWDREFVEFTKDDEDTLHAAAPVDGTYEHLFLWSNTKEVFLKREQGYQGDLVDRLEDLKLDHPQMLLRKKFLTMWVSKIMTADFASLEFWQYLDKVGEMHTGRPAFKHRQNKQPLIVDLQYLSLTLAWIEDVVLTIVMNIPRHELSSSRKLKILRAFNKVIAMQQDLFQRHYVRSDEEAAADLAKWEKRAKAAGTDGTTDLSTAAASSTKKEALEQVKEEKQKREEKREEEASKEDAKQATNALPEVKV